MAFVPPGLRWRPDDPRTGTWGAYLKILRDKLPKTVLLKNVEKLNAASYSMQQMRERVFVIGSRDGHRLKGCGRVSFATDSHSRQRSSPSGSTRPRASSVANSRSASSVSVRTRILVSRAAFGTARI